MKFELVATEFFIRQIEKLDEKSNLRNPSLRPSHRPRTSLRLSPGHQLSWRSVVWVYVDRCGMGGYVFAKGDMKL